MLAANFLILVAVNEIYACWKIIIKKSYASVEVHSEMPKCWNMLKYAVLLLFSVLVPTKSIFYYKTSATECYMLLYAFYLELFLFVVDSDIKRQISGLEFSARIAKFAVCLCQPGSSLKRKFVFWGWMFISSSRKMYLAKDMGSKFYFKLFIKTRTSIRVKF